MVVSAAESFRMDKWLGQLYRPEVWIEKDALVGVIENLCDELDITYLGCHGYPSWSEEWQCFKRQSIFSLALDDDMIPRSPIRKRHKPAIRRIEKVIWTATQVKTIIESVPTEYAALFTCVAMLGVRLGELLGLQWGDIDLLNNKLHVRRSLWQDRLVSPKCDSQRTIFCLVDILAESFKRTANSVPIPNPTRLCSANQKAVH